MTRKNCTTVDDKLFHETVKFISRAQNRFITYQEIPLQETLCKMVFDFFTRQHKDLNKPIPEFRDNDFRHASITKSSQDIPNGLIIEVHNIPAETGSTKKEFYIKEVVKGGIFEKVHGTRIQPGDRLVKVNGKSAEEFRSLWDINDYLKKQLKITIHVKRGGLHLEQKNQWDKAQYEPGKKI